MENIVYIAAPRDWFDYLTTGATLLLSVIAVFIAVSTARQQNKIALFEKRFSAYLTTSNVSLLLGLLEENADYAAFIKAYNVVFCTNFSQVDKTEHAIFEVTKHIKTISECAAQIIFLFDFIEEDDVADTYNNIGELFFSLTENKSAAEEYGTLKESCEKLERKYFTKIESVLRISKTKHKRR